MAPTKNTDLVKQFRFVSVSLLSRFWVLLTFAMSCFSENNQASVVTETIFHVH